MTDTLQDNGALLLISNEGRTEILVDINQRGNPGVQVTLLKLLERNPGAKASFVSLEQLRDAREKALVLTPQQDGTGGLTLSDLKDVSGSEKKILDYFNVARTLSASDIHFIISSSLFVVKMRIFGTLHTVDARQPREGMSLCGTAVLSMSDIAEPTFFPGREQDARLSPELMRKIGLWGARYSHRPTADGLIAVMRLIPDDGSAVPSFLQLGFLPEQIRLLTRMLARTEGKIMLTGPTGSGKSTTLRTACRYYLDHNEGKHLLSIEDPVEGQMKDAVQTPVIADKSDEDAINIAWTRGIRSGMRLDPDVMVIGEERDLISMLTGIYASQTGHLVLSTMHTNSALSIPERLITQGVNGELIYDAQLMVGLISQRLVPTLCPHCRVPWEKKVASLTAEERDMLERYCNVDGVCRTENLFFHNPDGCEACRHDVVINGQVRAVVGHGLKGRTVIGEVIETDNRLLLRLKKEGKTAARQYWLEKMNGISRVRHLLHKLNEGLVDPLMADRIVPLDEDERLKVDDE